MSRTNIDIDDELAAEVMRRFGLTTKRRRSTLPYDGWSGRR